jgi:hypothetical protein
LKLYVKWPRWNGSLFCFHELEKKYMVIRDLLDTMYTSRD